MRRRSALSTGVTSCIRRTHCGGCCVILEGCANLRQVDGEQDLALEAFSTHGGLLVWGEDTSYDL
eukprot:302863-Amphidinium_carterae.1